MRGTKQIAIVIETATRISRISPRDSCGYAVDSTASSSNGCRTNTLFPYRRPQGRRYRLSNVPSLLFTGSKPRLRLLRSITEQQPRCVRSALLCFADSAENLIDLSPQKPFRAVLCCLTYPLEECLLFYTQPMSSVFEDNSALIRLDPRRTMIRKGRKRVKNAILEIIHADYV